MSHYFLELAYKGTNYSGFQVQDNANTIQAEVAKAFETIQRKAAALTGSSRTDAGVHAEQNFFHFDHDDELNAQFVYKINALLPKDIAVKKVYLMPAEAHARFDAISREYLYRIHRFKNPFLEDISYYFPYRLNMDLMQEVTSFVKEQTNFYGFSKTNTQVKNFNCIIQQIGWVEKEGELLFTIKANRFLRGMVRLLTASILKVGRQKMSVEEFRNLFDGKEKSAYSVPAHGLFLKSVGYPENFFPLVGEDFTGF